jgi:hypothetical protein
VDEKISIMPYIAFLIFSICKGAESEADQGHTNNLPL